MAISDKPLSLSVLDAIRTQVESNWNVPIGVPDADQIVVARDSFEYPLTELRLHLVHYARNIVWPLALHPLPAIAAAKSFIEPGVLLGALFIVPFDGNLIALATATFGLGVAMFLLFWRWGRRFADE